jgi:hypothetical protein
MRRFVAVVAVGASLLACGGSVVAQETINADGHSGAASPVTPAVNADGPTVVYGDLDVGPGSNVIGVPGTNVSATNGDASTLGPGSASAAPGTVNGGSPGTSLLGPDGTYSVSDAPPADVSVGDSGPPAAPVEAAPVEAAPADTTASEPVATDSGDLDGDNYPDAAEYDLGLDPTNPDTDGDGVADGDELNIYGTDPTNWDTDGDGISDGDELFNTRTDPLTWNDASGAADGSGETAAAEAPAADEAAASDTSVDTDGDRLSDADEAALGTDPANPDSDGDGYCVGDGASDRSDLHDPASFPAQ